MKFLASSLLLALVSAQNAFAGSYLKCQSGDGFIVYAAGLPNTGELYVSKEQTLLFHEYVNYNRLEVGNRSYFDFKSFDGSYGLRVVSEDLILGDGQLIGKNGVNVAVSCVLTED